MDFKSALKAKQCISLCIPFFLNWGDDVIWCHYLLELCRMNYVVCLLFELIFIHLFKRYLLTKRWLIKFIWQVDVQKGRQTRRDDHPNISNPKVPLPICFFFSTTVGPIYIFIPSCKYSLLLYWPNHLTMFCTATVNTLSPIYYVSIRTIFLCKLEEDIFCRGRVFSFSLSSTLWIRHWSFMIKLLRITENLFHIIFIWIVTSKLNQV